MSPHVYRPYTALHNKCADIFQVEFTNRILNNIQRGLFLEVQDTGIYAWRQDRCHVFASTSDPSVAHPEPSKLLQNTRVELLSFEKYVNGRCGHHDDLN